MADSRQVPEQPPAGSNGVLHSWKEIAVHLRRDVRTVQRWEKSEGLPVHRHWHRRLGSVYAYGTQLDAWWANHRTALETDEGESIPSPGELASGAAGAVPGSSGGSESRKSRILLAAIGTAVMATAVAAGWMYTRSQPEAPRVLAALQPLGSGRVFAKATSAGRQLRLIAVPQPPSFLALAPGGKELYVAHVNSTTISVVDLATELVVRRIQLSAIPSAMAVSPDGARVYVALPRGDLDLVDLASGRVTRVVVGGPVVDLALTADGVRLYLAMQHAGLKRLDTATLQITRIPSVACPQRLALTRDQKRLYVNYQCGGPRGRPGHDSIDVLDVQTERSMATITELPNVGGSIRESPDGAYIWADGSDACSHPRYDHKGCPVVPGGVLHVIRTADHQVIQTIGTPLGDGWGDFAFSPDGSRLIWSGAVTRVLNTVDFAAVEKLPLSSQGAPVVAQGGRRVFLALAQRNDIAVLDVAEDKCAPAATPHAWWPADGTATDVVGGKTGELLPGASFAPGQHGQGISFDGFAAAVELESMGGYDPFSVSLWAIFHEPLLAETSIIEKTPPAGTKVEGWSLLRTPSGALRLCRNSGLTRGCLADASMDSPPVANGVWHHITIVKDKEQWALHVNGELARQGALGEFQHRFDGPLRLGGTANRPAIKGVVDEVQFFSYALSRAEVRAIHESARCRADEP